MLKWSTGGQHTVSHLYKHIYGRRCLDREVHIVLWLDSILKHCRIWIVSVECFMLVIVSHCLHVIRTHISLSGLKTYKGHRQRVCTVPSMCMTYPEPTFFCRLYICWGLHPFTIFSESEKSVTSTSASSVLLHHFFNWGFTNPLTQFFHFQKILNGSFFLVIPAGRTSSQTHQTGFATGLPTKCLKTVAMPDESEVVTPKSLAKYHAKTLSGLINDTKSNFFGWKLFFSYFL